MMGAYPKRVLAHAAEAESILELGIGHGFTTAFFGQHSDRHVVVEGSAAVIERYRASRASDETQIVESLFEEFSTDERFDIVVAGFVLEHVADPVALLTRYVRFLRPGGRLFAAVPNCASLHRRLAFEAGMLPDMSVLGDGDRALGHVRSYTIDSLTADLEAAELQVVGIEGLFLKPLTTGQLKSLVLDPRIFDALVRVGVDYPELCAGILAVAERRA